MPIRQSKYGSSDNAIFCCGPGGPYLKSIIQFASLPIIDRSQMDCVAPTRVRVNGPLIFNTIDLILDAALGGTGLAYLPFDQVALHIESGHLDAVLGKWTPPLPGYHLYYPSRRQSSPASRLLVDALLYRA